MTAQQLVQSYIDGTLSEPLILDNDSVDAYANEENVFSMHPEALLEALLDIVGVPWEQA